MRRYQPPAKDPAATSRRVYVLPATMVDQIHAFAASERLPSEVEAVRRLLDQALKARGQ